MIDASGVTAPQPAAGMSAMSAVERTPADRRAEDRSRTAAAMSTTHAVATAVIKVTRAEAPATTGVRPIPRIAKAAAALAPRRVFAATNASATTATPSTHTAGQ